MKGILFEYDMPPTTWIYVSSLMLIGIYFKFNRFFSVRNLDLVALLTFAPGLLLLSHDQQPLGYIWLFTVGALYLVRLLLDPVMVRRPLLEPNLSASGLVFMTSALMVFLLTNILQGREIYNPEGDPPIVPAAAIHGPGYPPFFQLVNRLPNDDPAQPSSGESVRQTVVRLLTALAQIALVLGIVWVGYRHFDNLQTGVAAAGLYLLLPYTAFNAGRLDHVGPAVMLVWAVAMYRRPVFSGIFVGLGAGLFFYPLWLLPLWCSYYWQRGLFRFVGAVAGVLVLLSLILALTASSWPVAGEQFKTMFGWPAFQLNEADGFWEYHQAAFRYPVLAAFIALCSSLALWPAHKNLGTLLSCSAAVMLAAQFWHVHQGGVAIGWYLPVLVLTILRPNLEDRVALSAVIERRGWRRRG